MGEQETERPGSSCSQTTETEQCKEEEVGKLSYEAKQEYWWAQAGHIQELTQEASVARAQKKQAEDIEAKNMRESFLLAEAMGVEGVEGANPYRQPAAEQSGESSQTMQLAKFLKESIRKKESNLQCPVCLEVTPFSRYDVCNLLSIIGGKGANIWLPHSVPLDLLLLQVKTRDDPMPTMQVMVVRIRKMIILTGFCNQSDELIRSEISNQPGF